ncbi:glycosyltransferase [Treponema pedis]|uniref:Glycosyltransferase n=1 Tax=Treponema pedis str. T A4 TaxID=1291379 RepID=S5ZRP7_9SPIR|nr:glycosyltransferase [Treponema pedis]AGT42705.1 glycosyltransferase [Treponema pedis str. T A4]QSI03590.1 glycosyltransferase [Treponema pedis]
MKKGLYIVNFDHKITATEWRKDGVLKKIAGQIKAFKNAGIQIELFNVGEKKVNYFFRFFFSLFNKKQYLLGKIDNLKGLDFVYIRNFVPINIGCIFLLKYLHRMGSKIIYEFPTYPYDGEHTGFKGFFFLIIDRLFRRFLKKYVDYVSTYSDDDKIFGIPTIRMVNGIDCSDIHVIKLTENKSGLNLIAVANFNQWHGYDRLIEGLNEYCKSKLSGKVYISFVGDGPDLENYKRKVIDYDLRDFIFFHGSLSGEDLDAEFNKADLAICSLGCHRINIFKGSFLKSREYLARGLPMISSTRIDILDTSFPYIHYVPENESPIDINSIIKFYDTLILKESRSAQIKNIRCFAEKYCDIKITMQPIIQIVLSD